MLCRLEVIGLANIVDTDRVVVGEVVSHDSGTTPLFEGWPLSIVSSQGRWTTQGLESPEWTFH